MVQFILQSNFTRYINDLFQIQLSDSDLIGIVVVGTSAILFLILLYLIKKSQKNEDELNRELDKSKPEVKKTKKQKGVSRNKGSGVKEEINLSDKKRTNREKLSDKSPEHLEHNSYDKSKEEEISKSDVSKVEDKATSYQSFDDSVRTVQKQKKDSEELDGVIQKAETDDGILYIGYKPTDKFKQAKDWNYAVVKMPKKGSVIKQPVQGKQQLRGYKEEDFQKQIEAFLQDDFSISGNALISTGDETRPYEPDILLSHMGNKRNIFIDIEIDEPYGGVERNGTHIQERDDIHRDYYFTDRGWIVIRFAEIQVHQQPEECVGLIAKVIDEIAPDINLPPRLLEISLPTPVEQWNLLQAQKWESENYREEYLGHQFKTIKQVEKGNRPVKERKQDKEAEKKVVPSLTLKKVRESFSENFSTRLKERDKRIDFDPEEHLYFVDGIQAKSVTEAVARFFPEFDTHGIAKKLAIKRGTTKDKIIQGFDEAREKGTFLHIQIENYFNEDSYQTSQEFGYFLDFIDDHSDLNTFRTEWRVFDENRLIAGTVDYVTKNRDGTFSIYDWKRSKNVIDDYRGFGPKTSHPFGTGFGRLNHIDSTGYNKYCLQQGIYKKILEINYGIKISEMYLVVLHPRYQDYHKFEVPDYLEEVEYIMSSI